MRISSAARLQGCSARRCWTCVARCICTLALQGHTYSANNVYCRSVVSEIASSLVSLALSFRPLLFFLFHDISSLYNSGASEFRLLCYDIPWKKSAWFVWTCSERGAVGGNILALSFGPLLTFSHRLAFSFGPLLSCSHGWEFAGCTIYQWRWPPYCQNVRFRYTDLKFGYPNLRFGYPNLRFWYLNLRFTQISDLGTQISELSTQILDVGTQISDLGTTSK